MLNSKYEQSCSDWICQIEPEQRTVIAEVANDKLLSIVLLSICTLGRTQIHGEAARVRVRAEGKCGEEEEVCLYRVTTEDTKKKNLI